KRRSGTRRNTGSHTSRHHYTSYTDPQTAFAGLPQLPGGMKRGCDERYLRAAMKDGVRHYYRTCKPPHKPKKKQPRGYWATYLTTAYCLTGTTASGTWTTWGTVAATLPFGTRLYIPGYGNGTVLDRGGAVGPGHVDLYMPSCTEAIDWGVRTENIEIFY
ncbi:MAG TPA: 3D domain-containing protein, partial [Chloroflexota bacterium]|nr:3D domain-containing protein [Chloroflexota bacterium]